jgi:signal transduction histidine kinase
LPRISGKAGTGDKLGFDQSQLLEIAAHDLRNPISGILAASQYLLEDAARLLEEQHVAMLQSIESSSRLMLRLIDDIMEIPALESGAVTLDLKPADISALIERNLLVNRFLADRKEVHLEVKVDGSVPQIEVDPVKMNQVINSLLTNAIKSARQGGKIDVRAGVRGHHAVISICAEGPAISADDLQSLFNPTQKRRHKRALREAVTALALANVKRIVEGHGGVMRVHTDPLKGSIFTIKLPLPTQTAAARKGRGRASVMPHPAG